MAEHSQEPKGDGGPSSLESAERAVVSFPRPGLTVYGNLLATLLFAITGGLYLLSGRTWFGVGWWLIGALWLRRYFWARRTPLLEIGDHEIRVHVGPYRTRSLPMSEIASVRLEDDKIQITLEDDSQVKFSGFDLKKDDMPRFLETLNTRRGDLPTVDDLSDTQG